MSPRERQRSSVLRLEGEFDLPAARLLEKSLRATVADGHVRIDFSRVRRFHDYGIAALAHTLSKLDGRAVELQGLNTHQVRLLRYFGIDAAAFRPERREPREASGED